MKKGQTSKTNGYENVLCPFTYMYMTQDANGSYSHQGSTALDVRGQKSGIRYAYYAPCKVKCVNVDKTYAFVWWQSVNKVRFANGTIDYVTFLVGHDNSINAYKGMMINQGVQLANMGDGGNATGVHAHIEVGKGKQTTWKENSKGVWCIPNQLKFEDVFFMDNTTIKNCNKNWKYTKDIKTTSTSTSTSSKVSQTIVAGGTYKLKYAKCLRLSPKLGNNIANAKTIDSNTKKLLVSKTGQAKLKAGTTITCLKISKEKNGRTWGSYGNCWVCLKNADGTMQCTRTK